MLDEKEIDWEIFRDRSDPMLIEDPDGIVIEMNRSAERAYGRSRDDLLRRCRSGENWGNLHPFGKVYTP